MGPDLGLFVGRAAELEALGALERPVLGGRPAAGVVVGDPGLGKSQLLAELAPTLALPRVELHGYEPAREVPLGAAGGLLRELIAVGEVGRRLEAVAFGDAATGGRLGALRLFEAAFRSLVEYGPLAIVVDDVQWVDRETLALLHYIIFSCERARAPLLVLAAARPAAEAEGLSRALAEVLPAKRFAALRLGPIELEAGLELAAALAPGLSREAVRARWDRAGGSPFWLRALLAGDGSMGPAELIRTRFQSLDLDAARLFALLVVAAEPLGIASAAELLGWPERRADHQARALANRALAVREAGSVRVVHDLVREAADRELPSVERLRLHGRLAAWLEDQAGDDLRSLLSALEHRRAAGLESSELALRIACMPQRRLLGREGLLLVCAIADEAENRDDGARLAHAVASLASELGEWEVALERWSALADRLPAPRERAGAALEAGQAAVRLERPDEVYEFVSRARALAGDEELVAIEADVLEGQALRWLENRVLEAQRLTDRAATAGRAMARRSGGLAGLAEMHRRAYLAAVRAQLDAAIRAGDADAVAQCAEEVVEGARESIEVLQATFDRIFGLIMFEGLPRLAEPRARHALAEARRLVLPVIEVEASHWLGWTLHYLGRLEEAEQLTWQTVSLAERVGPPERFGLPNLRATAYMASASRGDWRTAVAGIREQVDEVHEPHYRLNVRMMHVPLVSRFGSPSAVEVRELIEGMAADAEGAGCERCLWQSVLFGAEALARAGDLAAARASLKRWDAARPQPRPGPAARRAYVEALVMAQVDPAKSIGEFDRAIDLCEEAGQVLLALWAELDRSITLAEVDRQRGVEAVRTAARRADEMGALSERHLADQRLRALGARTWRRSPTSQRGALSDRERQVADLVAAGASNPDIARALFLSRKTVERHVSNVLAKLGAHNRVELVALLLGNGHGQAAAEKDEGAPR